MSLIRSNNYNEYTVGIALFSDDTFPPKPQCLIHEKTKDLNRTQLVSILSSWLRMDAWFLQFFLQIHHVHQPHPIIIDWMIVVISEEVFDSLVVDAKKAKGAPVVMIKAKLPDEEGKNGATYRNLIDALDEMIICSIGKYAIVDITEGDLFLMENYEKKGALSDQIDTIKKN